MTKAGLPVMCHPRGTMATYSLGTSVMVGYQVIF